jgi:predicted TIM-barrel fold metal-dependent hydrolase
MKENRNQAVREAQHVLRSLDAQNLSAPELLEQFVFCLPEGHCSEKYIDTFHEQIRAARVACERALERSAQLARMAQDARSRAAQLVSYAEEREGQAERALRIQLADSRFKALS